MNNSFSHKYEGWIAGSTISSPVAINADIMSYKGYGIVTW